MTKQLEKGTDKIQEICNLLRYETLDPAKQEAAALIEQAKQEAQKITEKAEADARHLIHETHKKMENERVVFQSALQQASSQCFEALKQQIQQKLFNTELEESIRNSASSSDVVAKVIEAIIEGLEKDGVSAELSAIVPKGASVEEINKFLGKKILERLAQGSVGLGSFAAGAQVKLIDKRLTLDISDEVLKELLTNYLRKDFRDFIFQA